MLVAVAAALLVVVIGSVSGAQDTPDKGTAEEGAPMPLRPDELVTMDFQNVEIATLVKFISEITGKNFVVDENIKGRVSVISPTKVTVAEAYRVFQSVLQVKGFTVVEAGPVVKVIPTKDVKGSGVPVDGQGESETYVTRIVPLRFLVAGDATSLLQPLISPDGLISAYAPTNSLIIVDTSANISRLTKLIGELDVEGQERTVAVIPLHHAYAADLGEILQDAVEPEGPKAPGSSSTGTSAAPRIGGVRGVGTGRTATARTSGQTTGPRIIADDRSNSIVVLGSPFEIRQVRALVAKLDLPLPRGGGRIHVYALRYADATELVQVIADLIGTTVSVPRRQALPGRSVTEGGGRFGSRTSTYGQRDFARSTISNPNAGALGGNFGGGLGGGGGFGAGGISTGTGGGSASSGTGAAIEFEGNVRVTADPATNSLVISAAARDYETIREVIERLDVARRQVLVEAILFEATLDRSKQLGIELQGGTTINGNPLIGRTSFRNLNAIQNAVSTGDFTGLSQITGLLGALISEQTIVLADGTEIPASTVLLSALQADTDINVLSAPNILTSDNEEAEIVVAQNVPFVTSRATDTTNLANTFSSIDRRDVGITLRITPQITEGDSVRLFVFQEVSALVTTSEIQTLQLGPTTTVRSATTTVVVSDDQTVAIGGLISDRLNNQSQGVPYLAEVPVLGNLFRFDTKRKEKVNLIILLTPHIIQSIYDLAKTTDEQRILLQRAQRGKGFQGTRGRLSPTGLRYNKTGGGVLLPAVAGVPPQ